MKKNSYKNFCLPIEFSTLIKLSNNASYPLCKEIQDQKKNYEKILSEYYSTDCLRSCRYLQYYGKVKTLYAMNNANKISIL